MGREGGLVVQLDAALRQPEQGWYFQILAMNVWMGSPGEVKAELARGVRVALAVQLVAALH